MRYFSRVIGQRPSLCCLSAGSIYILTITFFLIFFSNSLFAWNQVGHKVVAQIAYDNLTPTAKLKANQLTKAMSDNYPGNIGFVDSAIWADNIKGDEITAFSKWHYVNIPINADGKHRKRYAKTNVIWAIGQAENVLISPSANAFEKGMFLRFFIHFVGDIHQPLHATNYYSKRFKHGDQGGNLYKIKYGKINKLHTVWDQCFTLTNKKYSDKKAVIELAQQLQNQYPKSDFTEALKDNNPTDWAYQSRQLAIKYVYQVPYNGKITKQYQKQGKVICQKQLALAGYRLADILNQILS